jgi:hypothetical protein
MQAQGARWPGKDEMTGIGSRILARARAAAGAAVLIGAVAPGSALAQNAPLHPEVRAEGTVAVTLRCAAGARDTETVAFGVPFPRGWLTGPERVRVETAQGEEVAADASPLARWMHPSKPELDGRSLRAVLLVFRHACSTAREATYRVRWGTGRSRAANLGIEPSNVATLWGPQAAPLPGEHPATDNYAVDKRAPPVTEPRVWASLPADWLMRAGIRAPMAPFANPATIEFMLGYAKTYVNDVASDVRAFEQDDGKGLIDWNVEVEGWLYDRPFNLWSVYFATGDAKWLRHAHRASQYYSSWIARNDANRPYKRGGFLKKQPTWDDDPGDVKYSHNGGLFAAYLLTGDGRLLDPIHAIGDFVHTYFPTRLPPWSRTRGIWTERHLATTLAGMLYAYEATGEAKYRDRLLAAIEGMKKDVREPPSGYPSAAQMRGVLFHRSEVHEGGSTPDLYMAPWMAALLGEVLWRYHLISDDRRALELIADHASFVAERGLYMKPEDPHLGRYLAPWYGVGMKQGYTDNGIYDDVEHAVDVLGLLARGAWATRALGGSSASIDDKIPRLRETAMMSFDGWRRGGGGMPRYRLSPTRKFGWWFGSTYDMGWFGAL